MGGGGAGRGGGVGARGAEKTETTNQKLLSYPILSTMFKHATTMRNWNLEMQVFVDQ